MKRAEALNLGGVRYLEAEPDLAAAMNAPGTRLSVASFYRNKIYMVAEDGKMVLEVGAATKDNKTPVPTKCYAIAPGQVPQFCKTTNSMSDSQGVPDTA